MDSTSLRFDRLIYNLTKKWIWVFTAIWGIFVSLPFLAPVFMKIGWEPLGNTIYQIYSFLCHQLPQRSFFLFGPNGMYPLDEIHLIYKFTNNPLTLREFVGNPQVGWKVAWSDRMASMYTLVLPAAWIWYTFRKKIKNLPVWGLVLFLLPMAVDGGTHMMSDFSGIGQGFRDSNLWLAELTNFRYTELFYVGDALGSFNSWMRLLTGASFAVGIVWFGMSLIEEVFDDITNFYKTRFDKLEILQNQLMEKIYPSS